MRITLLSLFLASATFAAGAAEPDPKPCRKCGGTGVLVCALCGGTGRAQAVLGNLFCQRCGGRARTTCRVCHGKGTRRARRKDARSKSSRKKEKAALELIKRFSRGESEERASSETEGQASGVKPPMGGVAWLKSNWIIPAVAGGSVVGIIVLLYVYAALSQARMRKAIQGATGAGDSAEDPKSDPNSPWPPGFKP